eukprot:4618200-Alexandrium_andersonii.AAC.1
MSAELPKPSEEAWAAICKRSFESTVAEICCASSRASGRSARESLSLRGHARDVAEGGAADRGRQLR